MTQRSFLVGCTAALSLLMAAHAQTTDTGTTPGSAVVLPIVGPASSHQAAPTTPLRQATVTAAAAPVTAEEQQAFLNQWCLGCHSERARVAGLDSARRLTIDALDPANVDADRATWELIVRKVRAGQMPPLGMPRPDPAEFETMVAAIEQTLDRTAVPYTPPPGLHRLNRTEYANVVRDLLDLEIDPSRYLPSDDSTSGFDNIAGALGISSTLVEAYVSAAQKISRLAMGYPEEPGLVVYRTREDTSQDYHVEGLPFGTRGGMLLRHVFPSDGEYTVTVTPIFGDNMSPTGFGSVPCEQLEISLDGERLDLMDWRGGGRFGRGATDCGDRGSQPAQRGGQAGPEAFFGGRGGSPMQVRFTTTAGLHVVAATYPATHYAPLLDLDRHFMRSTVQTGPTPGYTFFPHVGTIRIEGPFDATPATDTPSRRRIFVCTPTGSADEAACARQIVSALATRAFRRPATDADVDLLMGFYDFGRQEKDFDYGIEMVLARVLASPQFIYRIEEEPGAARQAYRISDIDLASRLSFFLWSSSPDDELLRVATEGRLGEPAVLEQQVRRMLAHPKAEALAVNFAGQWLNLRALDATSPLPLVYPDFDDPLRQAMRREVELLFDTIVREDRSILDLLTADYTFVNERLARHYGIRNVYGSHFRRVTLGPELDTRRGLLGKGAFLATTSKPERTSPVTRGKWIMANVLGMSPPDPPADVPPLPPRDADPNAKEPTMRQKMLDHRVRPDCVQCHRLMDPLGFALEPFDAIGLERTLDEGTVIDAAAQVFDNSQVDGPAGLRTWLTDGYGDQFVTVATEKLLTYALGRGVDYRDMPLVRAIARQARADNGRFATLVLGVVRSDPFQMNARETTQGTSASTAAAAVTRGPEGD